MTARKQKNLSKPVKKTEVVTEDEKARQGLEMMKQIESEKMDTLTAVRISNGMIYTNRPDFVRQQLKIK